MSTLDCLIASSTIVRAFAALLKKLCEEQALEGLTAEGPVVQTYTASRGRSETSGWEVLL